MAHPNEALLHKVTDAFSRGDMTVFLDCFSDDIVVYEPGRSELAGVHRGKRDLVRLLFWEQLLGGSGRWAPIAIFADDSLGVVLLELRVEVGTAVYEDTQVAVTRFTDGRISELRTYAGDLYARDEFTEAVSGKRKQGPTRARRGW